MLCEDGTHACYANGRRICPFSTSATDTILCDGIKQCDNGEDEMNCARNCTEKEFQCDGMIFGTI